MPEAAGWRSLPRLETVQNRDDMVIFHRMS